MNKILVTTDCSTASKAGIRLAMQLVNQAKGKLIVFKNNSCCCDHSPGDECI